MASGGITPPAFATASKCRTGVVVSPQDTITPGSSLVGAHVVATNKLLAAALEPPPGTLSPIEARVPERPAAMDRLLAAAAVPPPDADAAKAARGLLTRRSAPNAAALEPPPGTPSSCRNRQAARSSSGAPTRRRRRRSRQGVAHLSSCPRSILNLVGNVRHVSFERGRCQRPPNSIIPSAENRK